MDKSYAFQYGGRVSNKLYVVLCKVSALVHKQM